MTVRFVDQGWGLSQFADQVLVRCPHCQSRGTVHAHWQPYTWTAHFECSGCGLALARGLQQSWDDLSVWQGPVLLRGRRPCGYCGHQWLAVQQLHDPALEPIPSSVTLSCTQCTHRSEVLVNASPADAAYYALDPHFGLPLYLQQSSRFGIVWAYNARHLQYLQGYIAAKQRIRTAFVHSRTVCARLPRWMKLAKHRPAMLRLLARLQQQL